MNPATPLHEPDSPVDAASADEPPRWAIASGLALWAAIIALAMIWPKIWPIPEESHVDAPPFFGDWVSPHLLRLLPSLALAVIAVWLWPALSARLGRVALSLATGAASCGWAITLALSEGRRALWEPLTSRHEYLAVVDDLDTSTFVGDFMERVERYPIHVKGHPPGLPLVLGWMNDHGFGGPQWATALVLVVWGLGIAAVVWSTAELGGLEFARRASAAVAFVPGAVWVATSFDALFAGAMAIAIALVVASVVRRGWTGDAAALGGGALVAVGIHLTYGLAPLIAVPVAVAVAHRRVRPLVVAAVGGGAVVGWFVASGFWWFDGLDQTRVFYEEGISIYRPYAYFTLAGNPGALFTALGPAAVTGTLGALVVLWRRRTAVAVWPALVLVLGAVLAVGSADVSGLSKAEVERIWLPFVPWIAVAGAMVVNRRSARWWLAANLALGLGLQAILSTPW